MERASERGSRRIWKTGRRELILDRTLLMGVINVTPDSFADGGQYLDPEAAIARGVDLVEQGADLLDVGGESTRPGAMPIPAEEELKRVLPVVEGLARTVSVPISIDTYKARVAERAIAAGVEIVNDISGLTFDSQMPELVASTGCGVVLMHIRGTPRDMQENPYYRDPVGEIRQELEERVERALAAGIAPSAIVIDPGIGFGKRLEDNYLILRHMRELTELGYPVLIGPSRKSFIGLVARVSPRERLPGTIAASLLAVLGGAAILRVHDVKEVRQAVEVWEYAMHLTERP